MNLKFNSSYRRYAQEIPAFLQNRPHSMVRHCMERLSAAKSILQESIKIIGSGEFQIKSSNPVTLEPHRLCFGDEGSMPHCSCCDWCKSAYPCKHFSTIFQNYQAWSWEALPTAYRNSVFLILDETFDFPVVQKAIANNKETTVNENSASIPTGDENEAEFTFDTSEDVKTVPLDTKHNTSSNEKESQEHYSTVQGIRDVLSDIRRLTFLIEDRPEMLAELSKQLSVLREGLHSQLPKEKGILLRPTAFKEFKRK